MLVLAAFWSFFWIAPIAGELPKITSSGGRSTTGANSPGPEVVMQPIFVPLSNADSYRKIWKNPALRCGSTSLRTERRDGVAAGFRTSCQGLLRGFSARFNS